MADLIKEIETKFAIDSSSLKRAHWEICEANEALFALAEAVKDNLPNCLPKPEPYKEPPVVPTVLMEEIGILLDAKSLKSSE